MTECGTATNCENLNELEKLVRENPGVAKSLAEKGNSVVEAYLHRMLEQQGHTAIID